MIRWILILLFVVVGDVQTAWSQRAKALPDFVTLQHAGSIGFASVGLGYQISKRSSASIHYGYVPENRGGELNIVAAKFLLNTWSLRISDRVQLDPLRFGVMMSYHFGKEFRSQWPAHRYPDGYYWWKTSMRAHLVSETSLTIQLRRRDFHSLTGYIELNTNELYLISYVQNYRSLSLADIIKVGYGIRANF
jgi:hypothetical protein